MPLFRVKQKEIGDVCTQAKKFTEIRNSLKKSMIRLRAILFFFSKDSREIELGMMFLKFIFIIAHSRSRARGLIHSSSRKTIINYRHRCLESARTAQIACCLIYCNFACWWNFDTFYTAQMFKFKWKEHEKFTSQNGKMISVFALQMMRCFDSQPTMDPRKFLQSWRQHFLY